MKEPYEIEDCEEGKDALIVKYELLTADKHMQCDALTVRLDMSKTLTIEQAFKGIETWLMQEKE